MLNVNVEGRWACAFIASLRSLVPFLGEGEETRPSTGVRWTTKVLVVVEGFRVSSKGCDRSFEI